MLRDEERKLMDAPAKALVSLLGSAVNEARQQPGGDGTLRLERLADLCAQVDGPEMVDALVQILDDERPSVRVQAAEALVDVAFERYAEMARGVERALESNTTGPALRELPWVIAEVAEPSAIKLLSGFLGHEDAEVVASAVEALASLGDPDAVPALKTLSGDTRPVELDEYDGEVSATLGQLVQEAVNSLETST